MRVFNNDAFRMDQVLKFKLDNYIDYYNYDLCGEKSDDDEYPEGILEEDDEELEFEQKHNGSNEL